MQRTGVHVRGSRTTNRLLLVVLVVGACFTIEPTCLACSCPKASDQQHFVNADVVFTGIVTNLTDAPTGGDKSLGSDPVSWTFNVQSVQKGGAAPGQEVIAPGQATTCAPGFEVGKRYEVFATRNSQTKLQTTVCDGTRALDASGKPYVPAGGVANTLPSPSQSGKLGTGSGSGSNAGAAGNQGALASPVSQPSSGGIGFGLPLLIALTALLGVAAFFVLRRRRERLEIEPLPGPRPLELPPLLTPPIAHEPAPIPWSGPAYAPAEHMAQEEHDDPQPVTPIAPIEPIAPVRSLIPVDDLADIAIDDEDDIFRAEAPAPTPPPPAAPAPTPPPTPTARPAPRPRPSAPPRRPTPVVPDFVDEPDDEPRKPARTDKTDDDPPPVVPPGSGRPAPWQRPDDAPEEFHYS